MYDFYIYNTYLHTGSSYTGGGDMVLRVYQPHVMVPLQLFYILIIITSHIQYAKSLLNCSIILFCGEIRFSRICTPKTDIHTRIRGNVLEMAMVFVNLQTRQNLQKEKNKQKLFDTGNLWRFFQYDLKYVRRNLKPFSSRIISLKKFHNLHNGLWRRRAVKPKAHYCFWYTRGIRNFQKETKFRAKYRCKQ